MSRLTKRTKIGVAYLANIKPSEKEITSSMDTCECLYASWQKLADYEDREERELCNWTNDAGLGEQADWATDCGYLLRISSPTEHKYTFCPYCGKRVKEKKQ